jgi:hypothetical protein
MFPAARSGEDSSTATAPVLIVLYEQVVGSGRDSSIPKCETAIRLCGKVVLYCDRICIGSRKRGLRNSEKTTSIGSTSFSTFSMSRMPRAGQPWAAGNLEGT